MAQDEHTLAKAARSTGQWTKEHVVDPTTQVLVSLFNSSATAADARDDRASKERRLYLATIVLLAVLLAGRELSARLAGQQLNIGGNPAADHANDTLEAP